ncbi:MAG: hypothetical protein ABTQ27_07955 [Amaricoccus sp.]|uniref:hypothetical protein n=1 Tax=Amaricoccus sp. TaxID=1872485 RepID=UPI003315643C
MSAMKELLDPQLTDVFSHGIESLGAELSGALPEPEDERSSDRALYVLAALAGAVVLARSVPDRPLADRILSATLRELRARLTTVNDS